MNVYKFIGIAHEIDTVIYQYIASFILEINSIRLCKKAAPIQDRVSDINVVLI